MLAYVGNEKLKRGEWIITINTRIFISFFTVDLYKVAAMYVLWWLGWLCAAAEPTQLCGPARQLAACEG